LIYESLVVFSLVVMFYSLDLSADTSFLILCYTAFLMDCGYFNDVFGFRPDNPQDCFIWLLVKLRVDLFKL